MCLSKHKYYLCTDFKPSDKLDIIIKKLNTWQLLQSNKMATIFIMPN